MRKTYPLPHRSALSDARGYQAVSRRKELLRAHSLSGYFFAESFRYSSTVSMIP